MKLFNKQSAIRGLVAVILTAGSLMPVATSCDIDIDDIGNRVKSGWEKILEKVKKTGGSLSEKISAITKGIKDGEITYDGIVELISAAFDSMTEPAARIIDEIVTIIDGQDTDVNTKIALIQEALRKDVIGGDQFADLLGKTFDVLPDHFWDDYSNIFVALYMPDYDLSTRISIIESIINDGYLDNEQTLEGISSSLEKLTGSSAVADAGIASLQMTLKGTLAELDAIDAAGKQLTPEFAEQMSDTLTNALEKIISVNFGEGNLIETIASLQTDFDLLNSLLANFS